MNNEKGKKIKSKIIVILLIVSLALFVTSVTADLTNSDEEQAKPTGSCIIKFAAPYEGVPSKWYDPYELGIARVEYWGYDTETRNGTEIPDNAVLALYVPPDVSLAEVTFEIDAEGNPILSRSVLKYEGKFYEIVDYDVVPKLPKEVIERSKHPIRSYLSGMATGLWALSLMVIAVGEREKR